MIDTIIEEVFVVSRQIKNNKGVFGPREIMDVRAVWAEADSAVTYNNENYDNEYWRYDRAAYTYYVDAKTRLKYTDYAHPTEEELIAYEERENSSLS